MQHFQPILIVIGILAIAAVLIHGYLQSRKEAIPVKDHDVRNDDALSEKTEVDEQDGIIGDVRIINANIDDDYQDPDLFVNLDAQTEEEINLDAQVLPQMMPENLKNEVHEDDYQGPKIVIDNEQNADAEDAQFIIQDDELIENDLEPLVNVAEVDEITTKNPQQADPQDIFIFNVVAKEGEVVSGHELLQFFLTAGFRFGEMSIFHRHLHSDGTGPVLFSIANMMAPGTFDPENMEQFRSQGVSFFLTVPNNEIDIKKAFDMMFVAIEQMAEEFHCDVLNEQREPLTEEIYRNYHERLLRYI